MSIMKIYKQKIKKYKQSLEIQKHKQYLTPQIQSSMAKKNLK